VDDNKDMQDLSKAQQQEFIDNLEIHRDTRQMGSCASNTMAAIDCQGTIDRISKEVCIIMYSLPIFYIELNFPQIRNLSECTGMCALVFFTCTHIHDSTVPS
jgi:hypothetical protein